MNIGDRVRYRYAHRAFGTIVRSFRGRCGDWVVRWDFENGVRELEAFENNLELVCEAAE